MSHESNSDTQMIEQCKRETEKYFMRKETNSQYCFEVWRRAIMNNSELCLTALFQIYAPEVRDWANLFYHSWNHEPIDALVNLAFMRTIKNFRADTTKMRSLGETLCYLRACTFSVVRESQRRRHINTVKEVDIPETYSSPHNEFSELARNAVWKRMCELLTQQTDRLLAYLLFFGEYKPAEISQRYPFYWDTGQKVSHRKLAIVKILMSDPEIRDLLGYDPSAE